jgi:hypothetical protein
VVRNHSQRRDAGDERVRLAKLAKVVDAHKQHEDAIQERWRVRRVLATLTVTEPVEDPTGFAPGRDLR